MKVVIMIDSFKGSLSSLEAGNIIKDEILKLNSNEEIYVLPIADGGEGTVDSMSELKDSKLCQVLVEDPLFDQTKAQYVMVEDKKPSNYGNEPSSWIGTH